MKTILIGAYNTLINEEEHLSEINKMLETFPNKKIILTPYNKQNNLEWINSWNNHVWKNNPEYYKYILEEHCLSPYEVIHFDDNQKAIESAKKIWIQTYFYDANTKDLTALEKYLKENL